jgi:hypothetical protein
LSCTRIATSRVQLRASLAGVAVLAGSAAGILLAPSADAAVVCQPTGYTQDGIELTASLVNPGAVTADVDAAGCNIGVFFGSAGSVTGAHINGAPNYYGILVLGASVNVSGATVNGIGEAPHNGAQHGVGIAYREGATGTISGSSVSDYQKNGIVARDAGTSVSVSGNTVSGAGPVGYIAQNGIQISYGATGSVTGNSISDNAYTGTSVTACGLLMFQADGVKQSKNSFSGDQKNLCSVGRGGGNVSVG